MRFFVRFRWILSVMLVLLSIAGLPYLLKAIVPNNAVSVWFVQDDPALQAYQNFQRQFGNDEIVALAVHEENGLFDYASLFRLQQLTKALAGIEGVEQVFSITNASDIVYRNGQLDFQTLIPDSLPQDTEELEALAYRATHSPFVADRLVTEDARTALLVIRMSVMEDIDLKRDAIIDTITNVAGRVLGPEEVHLGGVGVIFSGLNRLTQHDFILFVSLSYLVMILIIWLLYRNVKIVVLALGTIFIATMLTLEIYGLLGYRVNMITMILPTLIMLLGIMDSQHIVNEFYFLSSHKLAPPDKPGHITLALRNTIKPCLYTSLTTVAGFMALVVSPVAVLKELGIIASVGLVLALFCSFSFSALALFYLSPKRSMYASAAFLMPLLEKLLARTHRFYKAWWAVIILVVAVLSFGFSKVVTDTDTIGYFPEDHKVIEDNRFIQKHWGNYFPLEFTVTPLGDRTVTDPKIVKGLRRFVHETAALSEVRNGISLATFYDQVFPDIYGMFWEQMINRKSELDRVTQLALRKDPAMVGQLVSPDLKTTRVTFTGKLMSAGDLGKAIERYAAIGNKHFEGLATVTPTGYTPLYSRIVEYVMQSQKQSFALALGLIFVLMLLLLRNLKLAVLAVIPNVFPVLLLMGVMGFLQINLDVATATVSAIVIGFSIDDTIHFMFNYQAEKKKTLKPYLAVRRTFRHVGSAIVLTSVVIFTGYLVLLFASVKTVFYFGQLISIAIIGEMFAQLIILPLLLKTFDRAKMDKPATIPAPL